MWDNPVECNAAARAHESHLVEWVIRAVAGNPCFILCLPLGQPELAFIELLLESLCRVLSSNLILFCHEYMLTKHL